MSTTQYTEEVMAGYREGMAEYAAKIKSTPELQKIILEMLRSWMVGQNRNSEYYVIRDMVLPGMLGVKGASFFVEVCKNGEPNGLSIPDEFHEFISICNLGYGRFFAQAETFSISPLRLVNYSCTFNTMPQSTHISLARADGEVFTFNVDPGTYMDMVRFVFSQKAIIEKIYGVSLEFPEVATASVGSKDSFSVK